MAIGRVSGSMLTSNLDRQGIDLQFTTSGSSLVYMDFAQMAVGIGTNAATETLTINGNLGTSGLMFDGYTISPRNGGNVVIGGGLIVQGNTFTLNTNNLAIADSIISLHTNPDLSPLTFDDGKDIGLKFHYYKTADSHAFLGWANDTGFLEYYAKGTEGPGNTFVGTAYGTIKGGEFTASNTTPSTSTTSGALRIAGGAGIAGNLYAGALNTSSAVLGTAVATNFSSGNTQITGGSISGVTGAFSTLQATNFSTGNAQISGGSLAASAVSGTVTTSNVALYGQVTATATNAAFYPMFTDRATTGNSAAYVDSTFSFNPSTNTLTVPSISQSGTLVITNNTQATSTSTGALRVTGGVSIATGNLYIGGSRGTAVVHTGDILPSANGTMNLGSTANWYGTFYGISTQAQYADLAENYVADAAYEPGTVLVFGGTAEVTISTAGHDTRVAGIVSTDPAYLMNSATPGVALALTGRVPCRVIGPVSKGDLLVTSDTPGVACRIDDRLYHPGCVIGKSIVSKSTDDVEIIEVAVGRF